MFNVSRSHNYHLIRQGAGIAVANGLSYSSAIKSLTSNVATVFDIKNRGSIKVGNHADIVIWEADPLEPSSMPEKVFINGIETDLTTRSTKLRDRYTKIQKSFYEQAGGAQSMAYQQVRREVFRDYDAMDNDPILASALDIYADESTLKNEFGDTLMVHSDNEKVQDILNNLFYDILNVEFNLWPWVRNMCKYGDFFLGLEVAEGKGIVNVTPHSVYNTCLLYTSPSPRDQRGSRMAASG